MRLKILMLKINQMEELILLMSTGSNHFLFNNFVLEAVYMVEAS